MSDHDQVWQDLRDQAEELGIDNAASLTTEQLRTAIDERHRDDASGMPNQTNDQE